MSIKVPISQILEHYQNREGLNAPLSLDKLKEEAKEKSLLNVPLKGKGHEGLLDFIDHYFKYAVNTHHKNYANQLWSKTLPESIVGEFLAAVTNTSMYTYEVAPFATLLESAFIDYLTQLIWESPSDGIMTSGGTASNMQALLIARNKRFPEIKEMGIAANDQIPCLLVAENAHYSIKRAANILGLGHHNVIEIPVDQSGVMNIKSCQQALESLNNKQVPFALVSTAGTTVEGSFDDIEALGHFSRKNNLWFHVDGAYGANVLLSKKYRHLMKGVELCDSLSWDFHKMLGINLTCAFLLVKEKGLLKSTLTTGNDSYLFHDDDSPDLGPKSLQCGRRQDILKLWTSVLTHGIEGFERDIDKLFLQAEVLSQLIKESSYFELLSEPRSINICFKIRNIPNEKMAMVRKRLKDQSLAMINYSQNDQGPYFRFAVTRPDLDQEYFENILNLIEKVANEFN